jgi:hypothetical protein
MKAFAFHPASTGRRALQRIVQPPRKERVYATARRVSARKGSFRLSLCHPERESEERGASSRSNG